jgi:hypothetical protein
MDVAKRSVSAGKLTTNDKTKYLVNTPKNLRIISQRK